MPVPPTVCHLLAVALVLVAFSARADTFEAAVVRVVDGDSLVVLAERQQVRVRLKEIDAPELKQAFGKRSQQSLVQICDKKTARVSWTEKDRNGRTLGRVWCGGIDANAEQVRRGMAWVFDRYVKDRSLYPLQDAARSARAARSTSRCCARSASSPASRPACWRRRSPSSAPLGVDARIVVSLAAVQGKPRLRRA
jgi:endonuclease YncB( thermonuclease family)